MAEKIRIEGYAFGCSSLKTGIIIMGALSLIRNVIGAILSIRLLMSFLVGEVDKDAFYMIFSIIICIFYIVTTSILILGVIMERPAFLIPWLVLAGIDLVFLGINFVINLVAQELSAISGGIWILISGYFFWPVWSLREQLKMGLLRSRTEEPSKIM